MPRSSSTALNPLRAIHADRPSSSTVGVLRSVAQQRRGGHHDIGAREQVLGDVGGGLRRPWWPRAQQRTLPRSRAIHVRGSRASAGPDSASRGHDRERLRVDVGLQEAVEQHERVGARPRRARSAISPVELKYGLELDRDRHGDRVLDGARGRRRGAARRRGRGCAGRRAGSRCSARSRRRRRPASRARSRSSPPGVTPLRLGDHRDVDRCGRALQQAQMAAWAGVLVGRRAGSRTATRRSCRCRRRASRASQLGLLAAAAPRTASAARPRRRPRRRAAGRRRRCGTAATREATSGLRSSRPM